MTTTTTTTKNAKTTTTDANGKSASELLLEFLTTTGADLPTETKAAMVKTTLANQPIVAHIAPGATVQDGSKRGFTNSTDTHMILVRFPGSKPVLKRPGFWHAVANHMDEIAAAVDACESAESE